MKNRLAGALLIAYVMLACAEEPVHHWHHGPVKVLDANGHVIADLKSFGGVSGARVIAGNAATIVPISRTLDASGHLSGTDFGWATFSFAEYTSTDCTGDPIVEAVGGPRPSIAVRQGNDVTVYIAADSTVQSFTARSLLRVSPPGCVVNQPPVTVQGFATGAKVSLTRNHPEPLRIGY